jgi:hypothetical protein
MSYIWLAPRDAVIHGDEVARQGQRAEQNHRKMKNDAMLNLLKRQQKPA